MNAAAAVTTTGINWESVAAIAGLVSVIVAVMLWAIQRREHRAEAAARELKRDMAGALDHLAEVLTAKLEAKEAVADIRERLSRVEAVIGQGNGAGRA